MPLLLLSQSNDGSAHMHFTLRVAKRALAAPPPSMEDIVQRLADPERPACPIVRLDLIQPGIELPYGVSQGDFMVSSARIAAHLIRFAFGQRTPTVLTSMKPRALTSRFTAPKRSARHPSPGARIAGRPIARLTPCRASLYGAGIFWSRSCSGRTPPTFRRTKTRLRGTCSMLRLQSM